MNEESLNLSLRKFLKMVGVSSQGEIEKAVAHALAESAITGTETLPVTMHLEIAAIGLNVKFEGNIKLE
jgi:phage tail sheath gpL-like